MVSPRKPEKFKGTFWGLTTFFNPAGYKNKVDNFRLFRKASKRQGLSLVVVELAFDAVPFSLSGEDAEVLIQLRGSSENILWQKEALLNIALKHLPVDCDKVAWLDCDIIFQNEEWVKETALRLEEYVVVQPYADVVRLPYNFHYPANSRILFNDSLGGGNSQGIVCASFGSQDNELKSFSLQGEAGFAWCIRRDALDKFAFYDRMILGGADDFIAYAFFHNINSFSKENFLIPSYHKSYFPWFEKVNSCVGGSVGYIDGRILHLWHGELGRRRYVERHSLLKTHHFDSEVDIKKDPQGIWSWSSEKSNLHHDVKEYFKARKEEAAAFSFWGWCSGVYSRCIESFR
ncbi:MAG: hypothetical protein HQL22_04930 [Candidatus Omnitrophica bacterium]|nr:hypothetical protein [Candidatus Omnitrophota bacterium]